MTCDCSRSTSPRSAWTARSGASGSTPCSTRTIPSQHVRLVEHGILDSLKVPQPPPPLRIPLSSHGFTTQMFWDSDIGKWIEAASYALAPPPRRDDRGADRRDRRRSRQGAGARRLSELLVSRPRARQALDQPPRQSRALLRRPHARRRHRLLPGDRPAEAARHHAPLHRPHRHGASARVRTRSAAIAATRRSSWR